VREKNFVSLHSKKTAVLLRKIDNIVEGSLLEIARQLLNAFPENRLFAFCGDLGAGKTTFIKEICRALGVNEGMSSPSFSIINEYEGREGSCIYHFDFYRIKNLKEAVDLGIYDYFQSGSYCFMEWPERIMPVLPDDTIVVTISENPDKSRSFSITTKNT